MSPLRSSQVAAAAGVNLQTLRYYERRGLLGTPARSQGGHRLYPVEAVTVLRVIKAAQGLGFTLDEVADLLDTGRHGHEHHDADHRERVRAQLSAVEAKISHLQTIADSLREVIAAACIDPAKCAVGRCGVPYATIAQR